MGARAFPGGRAGPQGLPRRDPSAWGRGLTQLEGLDHCGQGQAGASRSTGASPARSAWVGA